MPRLESENRTGPRYLASLEVKAEWDEPSGTHIIAEGTTENVGPEGTLVHLPRQLPDVGSRVRLEVLNETGAEDISSTSEAKGDFANSDRPKALP